MSELLQFMYQGEVNVKQAELQQFMSIAESLQIKGLATNSNSSSSSNKNANNNGNSTSNSSNNGTMRSSEAMSSSYSQFHSNNISGGGGGGTGNSTAAHRNHNQHSFNSGGNHMENHRQTTSTPLSTTSSMDGGGNHGMKGMRSNNEVFLTSTLVTFAKKMNIHQPAANKIHSIWSHFKHMLSINSISILFSINNPHLWLKQARWFILLPFSFYTHIFRRQASHGRDVNTPNILILIVVRTEAYDRSN